MTRFLKPLYAALIGYSLLLLALTGSVQAKTVYTWKDEHGFTHFSHTPDNGINNTAKATRPKTYINRSESKARSSSSSRKSSRLQTPTANDKQLSKTTPTTHCSRYKTQLLKIETQLRRGYKEPKGNRFRQKRRELSDLIFKHCR